ncbi:50S ribosomal protein L9 [Pseudobacteroides cellulosolvens]|uniref:Large ribosomal subunit protein bL9 n=1 Tax=Pseudobacteroides cellulosolvens ATCC 35603 = DSM 2933 TaxID=398512 RepID=A0A0L6JSD4_9FIRM|nr:50S ribosomal protein L9 [Pseudobacteroides cellulosolvens]KNY28640.1 50S ribosomal protein L9 [Pseudobacteroides cellulosolvens ATCC 35603 = DSM 2933]
MKVILKADVKGLGKKDSLVEVSDGYARNFLMPKGLAMEATSSNINVMKNKNESDRMKKERELAKAKELAEKIKEITVVFKAKASEGGKLFGSITNKDVADKLKADFKLDVDKKQIILDDVIKSLGTTEANVKLYPEVSAKLKIKIENE